MGEHIAENSFCVKRLTIQRKGGTFSAFVRLVEEFLRPLSEFFEETGHDYTRFNYMGEWHSHHSFSLHPSARDHQTMLGMASDPELGARFVALLLVRLNGDSTLAASVNCYEPGGRRVVGEVVFDE